MADESIAPNVVVDPGRLLEHANRGLAAAHRLRSAAGASGARHLLFALLRRAQHDRLVVHERVRGRDHTTAFGPGGELEAHVIVHDARAFTAIATEGSIGLGRGYFERWWSSDDPVAVVRVLIRNMGPIDRARNRARRVFGPIGDRVRAIRPRDTRDRNRTDIGAHYDIGNDFFELFLDETMTYSSGVFERPDAAMADASRAKYDRLLNKLDLRSDHHLLEIGTGWGGLALRAADAVGCRVTTTTISGAQLTEATRRVRDAALADRVTVLDSDWRDLAGTFDRAISIEMIEAVDWRDYGDYFATIERCLAPDGLAAIQAICLPDDRWERAKNTEDFIRRFVFPNGHLPSVAAIERTVHRSTGMRVIDVEDLTPHYAETLRRWRERFDDRVADVRALGLDDRFCRLWRFYLAYCEAGFLERHCRLVQIVLAGPERQCAQRDRHDVASVTT